MSAIVKQPPVALSQSWGVDFCDYKVKGQPVDFQDLMIVVAENRATTVEKEVTPLTTRIRTRNKTLDELGGILAELTNLQSQFASNAGGWDRAGTLSKDSYNLICKIFAGSVDFSDRHMAKCEVEEWIQKVKSKIDGLNNESQTDMSRLQSLVDRRDESFSTASNLMSTISDTRSNLIRNL